MLTFECVIEEIISAHPGLYLEHCAVMAVALMNRSGVPPSEFTVQCEGLGIPALRDQASFLLRVSWGEETALKAQRVWQTEQPKPIVERAAVALAALLFARLIPRGQMRVTREGRTGPAQSAALEWLCRRLLLRGAAPHCSLV